MRLLISLFIIHLSLLLTAQEDSSRMQTNNTRDEFHSKISRKEFQYNRDKNHTGIGAQVFMPDFGRGVETTLPWIGVDILSDLFQMKLGFGRGERVEDLDNFGAEGFGPDVGYRFTIGANLPLNFLHFGKENSYSTVFRGHPFVGFHIGDYGLKHKYEYKEKKWDHIFFLGVSPGYRIRMPLVSIDVGVDLWAGMKMGNATSRGFYQNIGYSPFVTLRADGLKGLLDPHKVYASYQTTVIDKQANLKTYYYTDGNWIYSYTTGTAAETHLENGSLAIQDVGPLGSIGPKFSWSPRSREPYMNTGKLYGAMFRIRAGAVDMALNLEGGRIGHGSRLIEKNEEKGRYKKKVNRNYTMGTGSVTNVNFYVNVGGDLSPLLLFPFNVSMNKGEAAQSTSFLSVTGGIILGSHFSFDQEFDNPESAIPFYEEELADKPENAKDKYIDPGSNKAIGLLTGYYASIHVGSLSFTFQNNRYWGAPFASGMVYSVAYGWPIGKGFKSKSKS